MANENKRILVVDDSTKFLSAIKDLLEYNSYEVVCAQNVPEANLAVQKALETNKPFKEALIDLRLGEESGAEFAQRLMEMVIDVSVIVITAYYDPAAEMRKSFKPDDVIIKTDSGSTGTILEKVDRLLECPRICKDPPDVRLNRWVTSCRFKNINSIRKLTSELTGDKEEQTEKLISVTDDKYWINTVVYPGHPSENFGSIAIQTTIGCNMFCQMCLNWQTQKGPHGEKMPYVRALEKDEMLGQVYLAMENPRIKKLFRDDVDTGLLVNFTGAGDGLVNNLDDVADMIEELSKNKKPLISFVITTVGDERQLKKYLSKYIDLPRVTFYWSANSLIQLIRMSLMPGTRNHSIGKLADLFEEISRRTGNPTTASFALFKDINDNEGDAKKIASFFKDRSLFKIKLMAGCPGSLPDTPDITDEEVIKFQETIVTSGFDSKRVRIRKIYGVDNGEYFGCGRTEADFTMKKPSE